MTHDTQPPRVAMVRVFIADDPTPIIAKLPYVPAVGAKIKLTFGDAWRVDALVIEHEGEVAATLTLSPCASD